MKRELSRWRIYHNKIVRTKKGCTISCKLELIDNVLNKWDVEGAVPYNLCKYAVHMYGRPQVAPLLFSTHKKRLHNFVQPFAIYAILLFYIAYMKQFMLSALEDTLVKLIHKRIFF